MGGVTGTEDMSGVEDMMTGVEKEAESTKNIIRACRCIRIPAL